jgi:hypothetical protein
MIRETYDRMYSAVLRYLEEKAVQNSPGGELEEEEFSQDY